MLHGSSPRESGTETKICAPREWMETLVDDDAPRPRPSPTKDRCLLAVVSGPPLVTALRLEGKELLIGRASELAGHLDDPFISRRHARVFWQNGVLNLEDLGSRNGTFVGSRRVTAPTQLHDGDYVRLGKDVVLRCGLHDEASERTVLQLYEASRRDPLTELYNRRYFDERLDAELCRARRRSQFLSLIVFDLDGFRELNDAHGHGVGDRALRAVAEAVRWLVRSEDVLARYGGDEFALLEQDAFPASALDLGEKIRHLVHELDLGNGRKLAASVGVATREPNSACSAPLLLALADRALRRAKTAGGDRVSGLVIP